MARMESADTMLAERPPDLVARPISVAPMMDWTDFRRSRFSIKTLGRSLILHSRAAHWMQPG
jgi:hypothetical protein